MCIGLLGQRYIRSGRTRPGFSRTRTGLGSAVQGLFSIAKFILVFDTSIPKVDLAYSSAYPIYNALIRALPVRSPSDSLHNCCSTVDTATGSDRLFSAINATRREVLLGTVGGWVAIPIPRVNPFVEAS